jgi:hypothetical protein
VDQQPERVHVGGGGDLVGGEPFRRQVGGRAEQLAVGLDLRPADDGREAEVDDLRAGRGEHDVGRLDVAVHQVLRVRGGERGGHLGQRPQRRPRRQRPVGESLGEGTAWQQLHHHVRHRPAVIAARLAVVVHVGDVRVPQPGGGLRLGLDPGAGDRTGGVPAGEDLQRDRAVEHEVVRAPHHRHAAGAEAILEPVAVVEDL